jgi:hypothetical protein
MAVAIRNTLAGKNRDERDDDRRPAERICRGTGKIHWRSFPDLPQSNSIPDT